jgi:CDGSH-type Zn-finger protein
MFLVRPPRVYRVDSDTSLLIDVLRDGDYAARRRVLDIGTVGTSRLSASPTLACRPRSSLDTRSPLGPSCVRAPRCSKPAVWSNLDNATRNSWSPESTVRAEPGLRQVTLAGKAPVLVHSPVEVLLTDGHRVTSGWAVTALCTCRRSRRYPFCDASHRRVRSSMARGDDDTALR